MCWEHLDDGTFIVISLEQTKNDQPLDYVHYIITAITEAYDFIEKNSSITSTKLATIVFNRLPSLLSFMIVWNVHFYFAAYLCAYCFKIDFQ